MLFFGGEGGIIDVSPIFLSRTIIILYDLE